VALLLLPINAIRLRQMLNLVKKARNAVRGETSMEWLKPFMTQRKYRQGEVLCKKGDAANEMFLTVSGKFMVTEFGIVLPPGSPVGEIGFLTPNNQRTATAECTVAAQILTITYERLLELYFQNPQFGLLFCADQPTPTTEHRACGKNHRTEQNGDRPAGGNHRTKQDQAASAIAWHDALNRSIGSAKRRDSFCWECCAQLRAPTVVVLRSPNKPFSALPELYPAPQPRMPSVPYGVLT
jgi:hypothetical protein